MHLSDFPHNIFYFFFFLITVVPELFENPILVLFDTQPYRLEKDKVSSVFKLLCIEYKMGTLCLFNFLETNFAHFCLQKNLSFFSGRACFVVCFPEACSPICLLCLTLVSSLSWHILACRACNRATIV